jgi:hypothetical protein
MKITGILTPDPTYQMAIDADRGRKMSYGLVGIIVGRRVAFFIPRLLAFGPLVVGPYR